MKRLTIFWIGGVAALFLISGCKKFLTIPLPVDAIAGADAYSTDQTTSSVLNNIYVKLEPALSGSFVSNTTTPGLGFSAGLYTDELQNISPSNTTTKLWYGNIITGVYGGNLWNQIYPQIYIANTTIEAMKTSSLPYRDQWLGEALFTRALMYYYLVNLYGDVPLALSSDYPVNNNLSRTPQGAVYKQIIADLKQAQSVLGTPYLDYNGNVTTDRARPNQLAATALLARVYLYTGDFANAEAQATTILNNTTYKLETLANTFKNTSQENIWGILPPATLNFVVGDPDVYFIDPVYSLLTAVTVTLSPLLVNSFEPGDLRLTNWIGSATVTANGASSTYYYAYKYKLRSGVSAAGETFTLLRLAEQYLIRAEARAQQNNISGATADLNAVRTRAGLGGTAAVNKADLLAAITTERYHELFTEQGHRFFDLKRAGIIDAVMGTVSPQKGSSWSAFMQLWPIPAKETQLNLNLTQTPGYSQ